MVIIKAYTQPNPDVTALNVLKVVCEEYISSILNSSQHPLLPEDIQVIFLESINQKIIEVDHEPNEKCCIVLEITAPLFDNSKVDKRAKLIHEAITGFSLFSNYNFVVSLTLPIAGFATTDERPFSLERAPDMSLEAARKRALQRLTPLGLR
jgi:hypothetical protein